VSDLDAIEAYYLPGISEQVEYTELKFESRDKKVELKVPKLTSKIIKEVATSIKSARNNYLAKKSTDEIVDIIDQVTSNWKNNNYDLKKEALENLPTITKYSRPMVELAIDGIVGMFDKENTKKMLEAELEDPKYLDEFRPKKGFRGLVKAYGPELVTNIFAGNVPALPLLSINRDLLVKSATLGKSASEEPLFPALYAKSIEDVEPELAKTIAICYWQGGDKEIEDTAFGEADAIVAFGGELSIGNIKKRVPAEKKFIGYGHKMGFGVIGKEYLEDEQRAKEIADKAAVDVSAYDQWGCLSAQVLYVEKDGKINPEHFTDLLAEGMEKFDKRIPRGKIPIEDAGKINQLRGGYEIRELAGEDVKLCYSEKSTNWTVIYEGSKEFVPTCGNRVIRVKPIDNIDEVKDLVKPISKYLQSIGVALPEDKIYKFSDEMGKLGAARITPIGQMPAPQQGIPHDGSYGLRDLLRWACIEE